MLFVNFFVKEPLDLCHLDFKLDLVQLSKDILKLLLKVFDRIGIECTLNALNLTKRADFTEDFLRILKLIHRLWVDASHQFSQVLDLLRDRIRSGADYPLASYKLCGLSMFLNMSLVHYDLHEGHFSDERVI